MSNSIKKAACCCQKDFLGQQQTPSNILFVCTGNTCRSPMAEVLAKSIFETHGIIATIYSAGVSTGDGYPASENAVLAMQEQDLDLQTHKSKQISREILNNAHLVLTMTQGHLNVVQTICPQSNAFTLSEYAMRSGDVSDPYGGNLQTYRNCALQIRQLIWDSIAKIKEIL